ncbi:hypothetical protein ABZ128_13870 [Streptomyces sp. NPDC006326]|uniref:hypothetical protein n=1 Tax=Streptomyces sp. NPDC006326 TaxID=3156752 RepID=UPI0033A5E0AB
MHYSVCFVNQGCRPAADQLRAAAVRLLDGEPGLAAWWRPGRPSREWSWNALTGAERGAILDALRRSTDRPTRLFAARITIDAGLLGVREPARQAAAERDSAAGRLWTDAALAGLRRLDATPTMRPCSRCRTTRRPRWLAKPRAAGLRLPDEDGAGPEPLHAPTAHGDRRLWRSRRDLWD